MIEVFVFQLAKYICILKRIVVFQLVAKSELVDHQFHQEYAWYLYFDRNICILTGIFVFQLVAKSELVEAATAC